MSDPQIPAAASGSAASSAQAASPVHAAIARAAQATGMDFRYLLAQAKLESALDPKAQASQSSAAGLFQFTSGTWLDTLDRHGAQHGLAWVADVIDGGKVSDPGMRARIMGMRFDPQASALMAAELASDNRDQLKTVLGRDPDASELYLAHFLGMSGTKQFLSALASDPGQSAAAVMPKAAAVNRAIFYAGGQPRSVAGVMDLLRSKISGAMGASEGTGISDPGMVQWTGMALPPDGSMMPSAAAASGMHRSAPGLPAAPAIAARSMSDTLQGMFDAAGTPAPAHVRSAYAKLARMGL